MRSMDVQHSCCHGFHLGGGGCISLGEAVHGVGVHVQVERELEAVLDLIYFHGLVVELEALEVEDQRVRQHLDALAHDRAHLA